MILEIYYARASLQSIAVAHSGGADSTCLLYLLHTWITQNDERTTEDLRAVVSLIIDHSLQRKSAETAELSRQFCEKQGIPAKVLRIPWSTSGFPERPRPGQAFETAAREARYHLLFESMQEQNVDVLATGHHADDHVETLIMRKIASVKKPLALTPMRKHRRWGMMTFGEPGMKSWLVKPLLTVPKDRILATCEAHGLAYVNDPTNFQPEVAQRNFIRSCLSGNMPTKPPYGAPRLTAARVMSAVEDLDKSAREQCASLDTTNQVDRLYFLADSLMSRQEKLDQEGEHTCFMKFEKEKY
ncbi:hypothetical protein M422DRAFT_252278 [Sphaerobolus stellatus SS14]|uniref:tRNA(Ile)-lysidine synthetase n=1 Tax=Sphaerobolus stellatus (strain SS14) TaxID=990650 RepID=A0A0C9VBC1_SPHS4|nr:hypothetical protein M422DRAFT_252278 [Sphaerobolus stellatus SS14]